MTKKYLNYIRKSALAESLITDLGADENGFFDCNNVGCAFNRDGVCRFHAVYDQLPVIAEEDGCLVGVFSPDVDDDGENPLYFIASTFFHQLLDDGDRIKFYQLATIIDDWIESDTAKENRVQFTLYDYLEAIVNNADRPIGTLLNESENDPEKFFARITGYVEEYRLANNYTPQL